jgi:6-phosphogluconolactonase (cycloisomerase 2 family)
MRARDNVPRQQGEVQARGTESLPSGNTRWLVLDPNNREVYSFVHRSNQGEANVYAANWLRDQGLLGTTEFMVVPAR